jgi:hypothetical protein
VRGDHKQQLASAMLNAVKLACQEPMMLDPAPRSIRTILQCADLLVALGDKQTHAQLLETAAQLIAAMNVVLGGGSDEENDDEEDTESNAESEGGPKKIVNGDPRIFLELATRLLRDGGDDNLSKAMRLARQAHHSLCQLSGPDNKFSQEAEQLMEEIAIEQVLPPLLELGFSHNLCVEAVRASNLDVEAAKTLLENPSQLHAAIAESKYARTEPERMTWMLAMKAYFPGSFCMVQSVLDQIVSHPHDASLRTVRLASPEAHTHIAQVKEGAQLLEAVGFERHTLEDESGQAALVLDVPHLPVLHQALRELENVAALPIHEAFTRLIYRMYVRSIRG